MKIIAFYLYNGTSEVFNSMEDLLLTLTAMTEKRVKWCIRTDHSWRGIAFDEAA